MKKRFGEEQIIGFLKEADAGMPVVELCRKHGFSDASYYKWKAKFGGMDVSDAKRLKVLQEHSRRVRSCYLPQRWPPPKPLTQIAETHGLGEAIFDAYTGS